MQLVFIDRRIDWLKVPCGPLILTSPPLHWALGPLWASFSAWSGLENAGRRGERVREETRPWQAGPVRGDPAQGPHKGRAASWAWALLGHSFFCNVFSSNTSVPQEKKEKLQFKRKALHALFAYEWHLYN